MFFVIKNVTQCSYRTFFKLVFLKRFFGKSDFSAKTPQGFEFEYLHQKVFQSSKIIFP